MAGRMTLARQGGTLRHLDGAVRRVQRAGAAGGGRWGRLRSSAGCFRSPIVAVPASSAIRIADDVDFDRTAGVLVMYGTALLTIENRGEPRWRETVVVLWGSARVRSH